MVDALPIRQRLLLRGSALKAERTSWFDPWREIAQYLAPRSGRFLLTDVNKGDKKNQTLYDSTATRSLRVLAAGLMAGMTSPARPWFRLATHDPDLMESESVKFWLNDVTERMRDIFSHSNTYRALHSTYQQVGAFGVSCNVLLEDFDDVVRHYPFEIGEYCLGTNERGVVDTVYREFQMTALQLVAQFGKANCSPAVLTAYENAASSIKWFPVNHIIQPRTDREYGKRDSKNMPWQSCWFEPGGVENKLLRESGYKRFPGIAPRWETTGNDVYGSSPGMDAIGDIKQLQHQQVRKSQAIDYQTKPPVQLPASMKNREVDLLPGGISYIDATGPDSGMKSSFKVDLNTRDLLIDIQDVRTRIKSCFYEDLFLMLANDDRSNVTAREIVERHEEKLLMLGPVLERLHDEQLSPLINLTFDRMMEAGLVPPPPDELQGMELNVQFVSTLAQAQRAVGLQSVDRLIGTVATMAAVKPDVIDKLDTDEIIDAYADMLGVDPTLIVGDDKVAIVRDNRAKQQAAAAQAAQAPQTADTAKTLSQADTGGKNALTDVMQMFQGYGTQPGG